MELWSFASSAKPNLPHLWLPPRPTRSPKLSFYGSDKVSDPPNIIFSNSEILPPTPSLVCFHYKVGLSIQNLCFSTPKPTKVSETLILQLQSPSAASKHRILRLPNASWASQPHMLLLQKPPNGTRSAAEAVACKLSEAWGRFHQEERRGSHHRDWDDPKRDGDRIVWVKEPVQVLRHAVIDSATTGRILH